METTLKRTVKIYSTSTGLKLIESSAKTWGELQSELSSNNISYSNMNAVENVNNSTLMLNEAKLPEGEFVLMLTPQKTKSGSDYKTIRAEVVDAINNHGELAKEHFNSGGRNYTNKTKVELAILLANWKSKSESTTPVVKVEGVATPKLKVDSTTPKVQATTLASAKVAEKKMSFVEALKLVLTYDEIELDDYETLKLDIQDAIDNIVEEPAEDEKQNLSNDELAWINSMKGKL
jgi:hypothetical protein